MIVDKITEYTVYESPDGGRTVYARKNGQTDRTLHSIHPDAVKELAKIADDFLWQEIREAAKTNIALQNALENAILIYKLSKDHE